MFYTYMKRGEIGNELHNAGIILGLMYGLCSIPCNTTLYDCEVFNNYIVFICECDSDNFETFKKEVNKIYPDLCEFKTETQR